MSGKECRLDRRQWVIDNPLIGGRPGRSQDLSEMEGRNDSGQNSKIQRICGEKSIYVCLCIRYRLGARSLQLFSGRPLSKSRKALIAFACDQCGFTEFYAQ